MIKSFDDITGFEWDKFNTVKISLKHKVTTVEYEEVFQYSSKIFAGAKNINDEERYAVLGKTKNHRELTVIFTLRKHFISLISARPQSKNEKIIFRNEIKNRKK
jgi:uncharacterized DUF497 family protein